MSRKDNKINMPMSTAGITRYFEDYKTTLTLQPGHIIFIIIAIIILVVLLHIYGYTLMGVK